MGALCQEQVAPPELAPAGATRAQQRAQVERLTSAAGETPATLGAVRRLPSRRFMSHLTPEDRRAVERWLSRMPAVLRDNLKDTG